MFNFTTAANQIHRMKGTTAADVPVDQSQPALQNSLQLHFFLLDFFFVEHGCAAQFLVMSKLACVATATMILATCLGFNLSHHCYHGDVLGNDAPTAATMLDLIFLF